MLHRLLPFRSTAQPAAPRTAPAAETAIALDQVSRRFVLGTSHVDAVRDVTLAITQGAFVAITGRSGSGKSTLLHLIGGLEQPSSGEVVVDGTALHCLPQHVLTRWRRRCVGIVFQSFQLLPTLTLIENVMLPMELASSGTLHTRRARARDLLAAVDLVHRIDSFPTQASGGEQQRAAIARALANDPRLLIADEPTGNLDSQSTAIVLGLFCGLVRQGRTLVIATHDPLVAQQADRRVHLIDGSSTLHGEA